MESDHEVMKLYINELTELSRRMFYERVDALMDFYGSVFDGRSDCAEFIVMPADRPMITPTVCMVYREARFVLDSDSSENNELYKIWLRLHDQVKDALDPKALEKIEELNTRTRQCILYCRNKVMETESELVRLLKVGKDGEARILAHLTIAEIEEAFDSIIASYSDFTLQPH